MSHFHCIRIFLGWLVFFCTKLHAKPYTEDVIEPIWEPLVISQCDYVHIGQVDVKCLCSVPLSCDKFVSTWIASMQPVEVSMHLHIMTSHLSDDVYCVPCYQLQNAMYLSYQEIWCFCTNHGRLASRNWLHFRVGYWKCYHVDSVGFDATFSLLACINHVHTVLQLISMDAMCSSSVVPRVVLYFDAFHCRKRFKFCSSSLRLPVAVNLASACLASASAL